MVPNQPRTSTDIVLAPTEYQSKYRVFTVQYRVDSKDSSGTDIPFTVTMEVMIFTAQNFMRSKIMEVLRLYLAAMISCYKSMGPKLLYKNILNKPVILKKDKNK
jgi:hypothetical protein